MVKSFELDEPAVKRVVAGIRKIEGMPDGANGGGNLNDHGRNVAGVQIRMGQAVSGGVTGVSGNTLGSGNVDVYHEDNGWTAGTITSMAVVNIGQPIAAGEKVMIWRAGGAWVVNGQANAIKIIGAGNISWSAANADLVFGTSGANIGGLFETVGTTVIKILADCYVNFAWAVGPQHTSGNAPDVVTAWSALYRRPDGAGPGQIASQRAMMMVENGIQHGIGGNGVADLIQCNGDDEFFVRVTSQDTWDTNYGFQGQFRWLNATCVAMA